MHFKQVEFHKWSDNKYIRFYDQGTVLGASNLSQNANYYVEFGGFF
jgi:hypothetical protein